MKQIALFVRSGVLLAKERLPQELILRGHSNGRSPGLSTDSCKPDAQARGGPRNPSLLHLACMNRIIAANLAVNIEEAFHVKLGKRHWALRRVPRGTRTVTSLDRVGLRTSLVRHQAATAGLDRATRNRSRHTASVAPTLAARRVSLLAH